MSAPRVAVSSSPEVRSEAVAVRRGDDLDWAAIEARLREMAPSVSGMEPLSGAAPMAVAQFAHGAANLTYLLTFGEVRLVLRRPPFGELPPGAHDMAREYGVLSQLWRHFDRAPRAYAFLANPSVAGADAFVMEYREGIVIRDSIPEDLGGSAGAQQVAHAFIDAVADLHLVDSEACGLGGLGKPAGFVQRQVAGWRQRWDRVRTDGDPALISSLGRDLAATVPSPERVAVVHNDLHLANVQFAPAPVRVTSIFDWDMATLGDPLVDLGSMLAYWRDDSSPGSALSTMSSSLGLPPKAQVIERYAARTGIDVSQINWYHAFARWKIAIIRKQLQHRYLRGGSSHTRLATVAENIGALAEEAHDLLAAQ